MPHEGGVFTEERGAIRRSDRKTIHGLPYFSKPCQEVHKSFLVGDDSLGRNEGKLVHFLGQRVDLGGSAFHHHGDDRNAAVAERDALTAHDDLGVLVQDSVELGGSLPIFYDDADDFDDDFDDDDDVVFEVNCPCCEETICLPSTIDLAHVICPACGEEFSCIYDECEDDECGCCCHCDDEEDEEEDED